MTFQKMATRRGMPCLACGLAVLALALGRGSYAAIPQPAEEVVLHVNQGDARAADRNTGSEREPLRTIGEGARRAVANRQRSAATRVVIHPGVYRESVVVDVPSARAAAPPIVFEGTRAGAVIVSGADVLGDWQPAGPPHVYRRRWPYSWGAVEVPRDWAPVARLLRAQPIVLRRELLVVDGQMLEQTLRLDDMRARERTFFVGHSAAGGTETLAWIHLAAGTRIDSALVEAAARPTVFAATGATNLVVRNLVFRHANTPLQDSAVVFDRCASVLVEDCDMSSNNWTGLGVRESRDVTLRRVSARFNGIGGFGVWRVRNLIVDTCEASYNNWRGARGGFTSWAVGQKFLSVHGARFTDYRAVGNHATGLWFDTDNTDVVVERAHLCRNDVNGVSLEASPGPVVIRHSRICDNREAGVFASSASQVTLEDNEIDGNRGEQISAPWLADEHASTEVVNFETGRRAAVQTSHWSMTGNVVSAGGNALLFAIGRWEWFLRTLVSDRNTWRHANNRDVFGVYGRNGSPPSRLDFRRWQLATGVDVRSDFQLGGERSRP